MHATYSFLVDAVDIDSNSPEAIEHLFYERFSDRLDSNNYCHLICIAHPDGSVASFDPRHADTLTGHERAELALPDPERWLEAVRLAAECVIHDIRFHLLIDPSSASTYAERTTPAWFAPWANEDAPAPPESLGELPLLLERHLRSGRVHNVGPLPGHSRWHAAHMRKTARCLRRAMGGVLPFTRDEKATPYDYRAFDLRRDVAQPGSILTVDIHT